MPNSSFENWSTGNGYSVTVLFFPMAVYDSYTYPTGWNYPAYPVNETFNYSGMNVTVDTDIPLLRVSDETADAPYGSHAIRMESFMLSDIINPTVYNLAQSNLDSTLTASVFPTVLSTAEVNIDRFLPLVSSFNDNSDSLPPLMSIFSDVDLDSLFNGGIALEGQVPGQLTGYYKYTSAVGGDNGGIMMLGSKYNPSTQRRELVGYGYTTDLTDIDHYTSFEVAYTPLSEIDTTLSYVEADSLVFLIFSSANTAPQHGSALYIDRLQLWVAGVDPVEDTCSAIFNLTVNSADTTNAELSWTYEGEPNHFEAEYGLQGLCTSELAGDWAMVSFHTDTLPAVIEDTTSTEDTTVIDTTGILIYTTDFLKVYPNPAHGKCVVQFEQEVPGVVRLYSLNGALLMEAVPDKETLELTLSSSGIFLLVCQMKEGTVMRKIVNQLR